MKENKKVKRKATKKVKKKATKKRRKNDNDQEKKDRKHSSTKKVIFTKTRLRDREKRRTEMEKANKN